MPRTRSMLVTAMTIGALSLGAWSTALAQPPKEAPKPATKDAAPHKDKDTNKDNNKDKSKEHAAASKTARIGETAPDFTLTDTEGKTHTLSSLKGKIVVLEWFNPQCPVIVATHKDRNVFNPLVESYAGKNVVFLAINSGAEGQEGSGKDASAKGIKDLNVKYPVLLDSDGKVGHAYGATNTPHMYVVAADGTLAYMGAIDDGSAMKAGKTNYVKAAVDELLAGKKVTTAETKAYGCGVKYGKNH